jgi:hypothetical protein
MLRKLFPIIALIASALAQPPTSQLRFHIGGTIVDSVRNEVLPEIEVSISLSGTETVLQSLTTGSDGRFDFPGLESGKYVLSAQGRGYSPQGYEQHHSYSTGIVTGPHFETDRLTFRLKPDASIYGTVKDEFGDPVPLAEVMLFWGPPEARQDIVFKFKVLTNDLGFFQIDSLREGKYYLVVRAHPWYARNDLDEVETNTLEANDDANNPLITAGSPEVEPSVTLRHSEFDVAFRTSYYSNATEPESATPIVLKPGEQAIANFGLSSIPAVSLKIQGTPAFRAGGSVVLRERIFSSLRHVATQDIDREGARFDSLSPGRYVLEISPGAGSLPEKHFLDLVSDVEVVPGEGARSVAGVTGTIHLDDTGQPCVPCRVSFLNASSREVFFAQNKENGFEVDGGLSPGNYLVWVSSREHYWVKGISSIEARVTGEQIEVRSGTSVRLSILMTKGSGTVEGVALSNGKPVSGAAVLLIPDDSVHNLDLFWGDQSDSDGTFGMRWILPGEYTLVAISEGWDLEWTNPASFKPYLNNGVRIHIQPGSRERVEVLVQSLEGASK